MKICVTAASASLDAQLDPRFGRCTFFIIIDTETMQFEAIPNPSQEATGGAGIQAAQLIVNKGVKVLITGNVGPNAFHALSTASVEIITGASGAVREVAEQFKQGKLKKTSIPTVGEHSGMSGN
jgi:predicted Fe-Mo cluster-binding NifX family protein